MESFTHPLHEIVRGNVRSQLGLFGLSYTQGEKSIGDQQKYEWIEEFLAGEVAVKSKQIKDWS